MWWWCRQIRSGFNEIHSFIESRNGTIVSVFIFLREYYRVTNENDNSSKNRPSRFKNAGGTKCLWKCKNHPRNWEESAAFRARVC